MSFPEAAEDLARRAGIRLVSDTSPREGKRVQEERERLRNINNLAVKYFQHILLDSPVGKEARDYLKQRGVPDAVVSSYSLGCAPDLWNGLLNHLSEKKVDLSLAEKAGLLIRKGQSPGAVKHSNGSGYYDRFRHRIVFPIHDVSGKIVGFGGRALGGEEPKYLNSPDSPLYSKGKVLFGLHIAREHMKKEDVMIIIEGYFDLLALHIHGFKNSVATLGTGLTSDHVDLLRRYVKNVVVAFDPDEGGKRAAQRSLKLFLEKELYARIVLLPEGDDPDTFLRRYGRERFLSLLHSAPPLTDFVLEECARRHGGSIQGKARAVDALVPLLYSMRSPVMRDLYMKKIAETVRVREEAVRECYRRPRSAFGGEPSQDLHRERAYPRAEELIVRLMVHHAEAIHRVKNAGVLANLRTPALKALGEKLIEDDDRRGRIPQPDEVVDILEDEEQKALLSRFAVDGGPASEEDWEKTLDDTLRSLTRAHLREQQRALDQKLRRARDEGNEALVSDLQKQWWELEIKERGLQ